MITYGILYFFGVILGGLVNIFPILSLPLDRVSDISSVLTLFAKFSYYIPVDTFFQCCLTLILLTNTQFVVWVANWITRRIADIIP
jgi:hypothetical protein